MEQYRELLTYRICAATRRFHLDNSTISLRHNTIDEKLIAEEIYWEAFNQAKSEGIYDEVSYLEMLIDRGMWSENEENRLADLPQLIDDLKVNIFQSILKSNDRTKFRKQLLDAKKELYNLRIKKSVLNYATCDGVANLAKTQYLVTQSILNKDININGRLIHNIRDLLSAQYLSELQYRDLAQNDPWRSLWSCAADKNPFGIPSCEWSDEQITMVSWSKLYDSVYAHPEAPHSSVIEDNDMVDGWLLLQKRKREEELEKRAAEDLVPESMQNCGEVFVMAQTIEDARKIDNLNDSYSKAIKQSRMNALKREGVISHQNLPDVKSELSMEYTKMQSERFRK